MKAFGDSITYGVGASEPDLSWFGRFAANKAVCGDQAADVSRAVQSLEPRGSDKFSLIVGTNDHRTYGSDPEKMEFFRRFVRQCLVWIAVPQKVRGRDSGMSYCGSWGLTVANTIGTNSTQQGASASAAVSGDRVFIGYIIQNHPAAGGDVAVKIDGEVVGTVNSCGSMNTVNGATYAPACAVFDVCPGPHAVELQLIDDGKIFYLDYVAGNAVVQDRVRIGNIIRMSQQAYAVHGSSDGIVASYNQIISEVAEEFGLSPVNLFGAIDPAVHLFDGVHPNDAGHEIIYELMTA